MSDEPNTNSTPLQHLQATLEAALHLTRDLTADQSLARLLAAFRAMPAEDRPAILEAVEREVQARKLSLATESVSGQSMVPNRNARLYLRVHEAALDRNLLERDEMMIAMARGMRAAILIPAIPDIHASWREATREAMEHVDEATRAVTEQLMREVLEFIAEARAAERGAESSAERAPDAAARDARES